MRLDRLAIGEKGTIIAIVSDDAVIKNRLNTLGIVKGERVEMFTQKTK